MHEGHEVPLAGIEGTAHAIVDSALAVHRATGPGLLESTYEICLSHELQRRGHKVVTQLPLPVTYDSITLDAGYRIDLMVDDLVIVEVKAVAAFAPIHEAQLLTYLRLSRRKLGFLINFNVVLLKQGIKRMVL
ncbi:MAG TPA: GxxExxY protein [Micropepsaceae bacterium]|nr:GxxExxY protein [Micropepsaceae bacterium]